MCDGETVRSEEINEHPVSLQWSWLLFGINSFWVSYPASFWPLSLGGRAVEGGCGCRRLQRALVGAQEHLVLGGTLRAAGLLLHQELLEPVGGEGESLTLELHQVGVLQPALGEAVTGRRASPESRNHNINSAQTGPRCSPTAVAAPHHG